MIILFLQCNISWMFSSFHQIFSPGCTRHLAGGFTCERSWLMRCTPSGGPVCLLQAEYAKRSSELIASELAELLLKKGMILFYVSVLCCTHIKPAVKPDTIKKNPILISSVFQFRIIREHFFFWLGKGDVIYGCQKATSVKSNQAFETKFSGA